MVYSRILGTAASLTHHTNKMCPSISISIYISIMKTVVAPSMLLLVLMMVFISSAGGSSLADDDVHGSSRAGGSGGLLRGIPSASSLLAHGCPSSCGGVQFSYPFGIGRGCFRQGFELTCDHTAAHHPPKLLLGNSTSSIQLTYAYPATQSWIGSFGFNATMGRGGVDTYNNVYWSWETPDEGVFISRDNALYVVGCNVDAFMFGDNMTDLIGSCMSVCTDDREAMERVNFEGYCVMDKSHVWSLWGCTGHMVLVAVFLLLGQHLRLEDSRTAS